MLLSQARRLAAAARLATSFPPAAASLFSSTASTSAAAAKETLSGLSTRGGFSLAAKTVLVRADLNVPLDTATAPPTITNDKRIRAVLPTLRHLIDAGARVVVCSHMGRPKGEVHSGLRLADVGVGARLSELLGGHPVQCADDCVGPAVAGAVDGLGAGEVLLLENVRFHAGEEKNDPAFVQALADAVRADVFVNDAFGTAHRAHGTTAGIAAHVDHAVAGFLLDKELQFLQGAVEAPNRPLAAVVGGAKVSTKIPVLQSLLGKCDKILLGGDMIFTFYRAQGLSVGDSLVEEALIPAAAKLIEDAKRAGVDLILPTDVVVASEFKVRRAGTMWYYVGWVSDTDLCGRVGVQGKACWHCSRHCSRHCSSCSVVVDIVVWWKEAVRVVCTHTKNHLLK